MSIFFSGSSEQTLAAITERITPGVSDKLAMLSIDEPLPGTRPVNRIRLLVQSPGKLYIYWELATDPLIVLRQSIGTAQAENYKLVVRLINLDTRAEILHAADTATRAQWFGVRPGHEYRVDVGLAAPERSFIRLLSSNMVRTPRAGVSRVTESAPEFHVSPHEFARVLDEAGYASDALEVALEAADAASHDQATRELFGKLTGTETFTTNGFALAEVRALLAALALGTSLDSVQPTLSPAFARWLEELIDAESGALDVSHLLALLRSTLHFELNFDAFGVPSEADMRLAARFVWSASRVNLPSPPPRVWLPSMTWRFGRA